MTAVAGAQPVQVGVALAPGVLDALASFDADVRVADECAQGCEVVVVVEGGGGQLDVVERDGRSVLLSRFDALGELQSAPDEWGEFFLELRVSPAVPHRARGGLDEVRVIPRGSIMPCVRH
ncbi:hypothetical protein [Dermacoccus barathri]|uniref:hypothetical protein n=1 Tax=Dermacoccus barathri TaxID=322601 RepID=UPI0029D41181|nr:hypothetical protein [Dermacoccus barathri]